MPKSGAHYQQKKTTATISFTRSSDDMGLCNHLLQMCVAELKLT